MKKIISSCLILILSLSVGGCTSGTASNTSTSKKITDSNNLYKESATCSKIILNRINNNQQLNDTEQKEIGDYIKKGDLLLDNETNNYDWRIICSIKAANTDLDEYFTILNNKTKYTAEAKKNNETYDEFVKSRKDLIVAWCNDCVSTIKANVK